MSATKQTKKEIEKEKLSKVPLRVLKREKEEMKETEGEAIQKPKNNKKKIGIVAIKHKAVYDRLTVKQNGGKKGKVSMYEAMLAEGYSEEYARKGSLPKTKTWEKLLEERLGDDKLSNIHQQLMVAKKLDYMLFTSEIKDEDVYTLLESVGCTPKKIVHGIQGTHVWFWAPDSKTRKDALELAFKIRGKMSPEVVEVRDGLKAMSDADLAVIIKKQTAKLTKKD
jgi:hypothetical protein